MLNWRDIRNPSAGGAEVFTHEVMKRWVSWGHKVRLVSSRFHNCPNEEVIDGVEVHRVGNRFTVYYEAFRHFQKNRGSYDLVIDEINGIPFFTPSYVKKPVIALIHQIGGGFLGRVPIRRSMWVHEFPPPISLLAYCVEPFMLRSYARVPIVTCSPSTKSDLMGLGVRGEGINVVRPGIDDSFLKFEASGRKFDHPTIICISRFQRYKGLHYAIRAMEYVLKEIPSAHLIIVGNGNENEVTRELAQTNCASAISIVKRRPHCWSDEKKRLLSKAHLLLVPSMKEGYGMVVIEANACGTPAIGWRVQGLKDSIIDGQTGVLVEFGNVKKLGEAIATYLRDNRAREKMAASALVWARGHSWEKCAREFGQVIESVGLKPTCNIL